MTCLRAVLFNVAFVVVTILLGVIGLGVRAGARHRALDLARLWVRLTLALLRRVGGVEVVLQGRHNLPPGPVLIASSHRSALDALVWLAIVPRPSYVMKQELRRIPLVGPLLEPAGMIAIDRAGGPASLRRLIRDASDAVASGRQLVIFPEGTRVAAGKAASLLPGISALASRGLAPVVPVATDSGLAWGGGLLLRRRAGAPSTIHIVIGPTLPPVGRREDPRPTIEAAWRHGEQRIASVSGEWARL